ncbi:MAG: hypothetical protein RL491_365 [Bacteroidota bacterium]|jgi:hypothetical protein
MQVFEYYDDYQHTWELLPEHQRKKVRYVILGDLCVDESVICYLPDGFVEVIGKKLHEKAWVVDNVNAIKEDVIAAMTRERERYLVDDYKAEIEKTRQEAAAMDSKFMLTPGHSSSGYDGRFGVHYQVRSGESYSGAIIAALEKKMKVLEVREKFCVR